MTKPLIIDAHEDLAWNMLCFGRDYTRPMLETRQKEAGTMIPAWNGDTLLGYDVYRGGNVAIAFSTLFAAPDRAKLGDWDTLCYDTYEVAHQQYRKQIEAYHRLVEEHPEHFSLLLSAADVKAHLARWNAAGEDEQTPVGLVVLMEAAEGVRDIDELADWWEWGVRLIGPAWAGTRWCGGTREPGPLTEEGFALLEHMAEHGFVLDLSHMDEAAVLQSLDHYPGRIIASHANAKALMPGTESNRFLSDRVISGLIERDGISGIVPLNAFLQMGWKKGSDREAVTIGHLVAQIDHVCQLAGNARHVGIGSDFDGGFGVQSIPTGMNSLADLQMLVEPLAEKGYTQEDIALIMGGNWKRILLEALPA